MLVTLDERGDTALPYEAEGELFRIASEALVNVRLHANASRIAIELDARDGEVALRIRDDGVGFDPSVRDDERYGLRGMEERAALAGGSFRVESDRASGTVIEAVLPKLPHERGNGAQCPP